MTTGGRFVASTLDVTNDAFMNGGPLSLTGDSCGVVVNLGKIGSSQGDVFLISRKAVVNEGTIARRGNRRTRGGQSSVAQGFDERTAGLRASGQPGQRGQQRHDQRRADQPASRRWQHLRARGRAQRVACDRHRNARRPVWLVADSGTVQSHGYISASNSNGSGGTVDTSAKTFEFDRANVDAAQWNVTAPAYVAGPRSVAALASNLSRGTSITVERDERRHRSANDVALEQRRVAHAEREPLGEHRLARDDRQHGRRQSDLARGCGQRTTTAAA